ncbi:GntR family transcriptional regulator [Actibacterium sp. D379-3]
MPRNTQAGHVYQNLRSDILACRLPPSGKIKINDICTKYEVSLGAAREALSRLVADGIVRTEPQKGFSVAPISRKELTDLTEARIEIENMCLAQAIEHGDVEWESRIVAAFHKLSRIPENVVGDTIRLNETWSEAHRDFHDALVAACPNLLLLHLREQLYAQSERYRHWSVSLHKGPRDRDVASEHKRIMEATLARDVDAARQAIADHTNRTTADVLALTETLNREIA